MAAEKIFCYLSTMQLVAIFLVLFARESFSLESSPGNLPVFNISEAEKLLQNRRWQKPSCFLFQSKPETSNHKTTHDGDDKAQPISSAVEKSLIKLKQNERFNGWSVGKLYMQKNGAKSRIISPATDGVLRCYIGTASHFDYAKELSVKKWLHKMLFAYKNRLKPMLSADASKYFQEDISIEFYIIVFPGNYFFEVIEKILKEVRRNCADVCSLLIVPPDTEQERKMAEQYETTIFPAALIFHRKRKGIFPILRKKLQGVHEVNSKENILQAVLLIRLDDVSLTFENFASNALNSRTKNPFVVCFFSSNNPTAYKYLNALYRAMTEYSNEPRLKNTVRFGVVDIAYSENSKIITRYLDAVNIKSIPFIAVFWQISSGHNGFSKLEIQHKILSDLVPTPWNLEVMLENLKINKTKMKPEKIEEMFCSANSTQSCSIGDFPEVFYGPVLDSSYKPQKAKKKIPMIKKFHGIPLLTDSLWHPIIDRSPSRENFRQGFLKDDSKIHQHVKLVIFIMADCGYCKIMMPSFQKLAKSAKTIHGVSVYLMNCTSDPIQCKANNVNGYPTLAMFRSVSEEESRNCMLKNSTSSSVRLDYHGDMEIDNILMWLSKAAMSAVKMEIKANSVTELKKDVRLTARLYTKNQAKKYLSRSLQQKLIPFQCFKLACERLFATVECVARQSSDVETEKEWHGSVAEKNLVIEMVEFERIDGVIVTVFKMNYPMENTMVEKTGSELHMFHKKHRYNIPSGFKCENDHPLCIHILVRFVEDHLRLPVTHITNEGFHTYSSSSLIFSKEIPLLIALVQKENISANSSFLRALDDAARKLYTKIMFATLNVDEYPSWASQFVPRDYHYKNHDIDDRVPVLYNYPRICIIDWNDHQHAAFYPKIEVLETTKDIDLLLSNIVAADIIKFSEQYFLNKESLLIETEMF